MRSVEQRARKLWVAGAALLGLLAATTALAYAPLGRLSLAVALVIAISKAAIILVVFMELLTSPSLVRVMAAAGLVWLWVLIGMPALDYLSRRDKPVDERLLDRTVVVPPRP